MTASQLEKQLDGMEARIEALLAEAEALEGGGGSGRRNGSVNDVGEAKEGRGGEVGGGGGGGGG